MAFYADSVLSNPDILEIEKPGTDAGLLIATQEVSSVLTLATLRKYRSGAILASAGATSTPSWKPQRSRW
jgi:hypothetical protein